LDALFNDIAKDIIAYLDRSVITLWTSPCGREIISILKTHKHDSESEFYVVHTQLFIYNVFFTACYYLLPRVNYCTCNDYKRIILNKEQKITCRHVAAVWLALTLNVVNTYNITEDKFNSIFNEFLSHKKEK